MTPATPPHRIPSSLEALPESYTSEILKKFVDTLVPIKNVQILDIGPVCEENIMFFASRMRRHYVCDMFLRLDRQRRKGGRTGDVWRHLDYSPLSFDGIHLWDLCDHLDDGEVGKLVEVCRQLLQPEGLLMLTAYEAPPPRPLMNTFVVHDDYQIDFRPQSHLKLAWNCRHNRALMSLLTGLNIVKSLRYRNGIREILLKKPLPVT